MIAATIAAALRVTSRIPRRHRTAFAVGCGGAGASSALLVTGSARAAPSSGGLAAVKGQSEPPLVSGKPRTPSAANPFVTTVWAYATEADRRASINPEKIEQIKTKKLRPSGIMQFEKDGAFMVKTIWVDDMDRAMFHPNSRDEIARRAAKKGIQLVAGAPYKRLRFTSSKDYSHMTAFDVRAKHPSAAEYIMARIESSLLNDGGVEGLDNVAFNITSPSTFTLYCWWTNEAAMRSNMELASSGSTPELSELMLGCDVHICTNVRFDRVGVGVTTKL